MNQLPKDTTIKVETYRITHYQPSAKPYEGHHPNREAQIEKTIKNISFLKGDYYISLNQAGNRFLIEILEPNAEDSYFTWNFFDPILNQKEGFSDYVFEETAMDVLEENPELKAKLEQRIAMDTSFAKNEAAQLEFIYKNSRYYEPAHLQYPVYRVLK